MQRSIRLMLVTIVTISALSVQSAISQTPETGTPAPGASPAPPTGMALLLPTEGEVPDGLVMIDDGERTLRDITDGFSDPEEARSRFEAWGWERNVIRAFHTPADATSDPSEIDGVYISVHAFGSREAASEALDYTVDIHRTGGSLNELEHPGFGDRSAVLFGEESYGDEVTIYVQQDHVLIRLSASSPEGDPTEEAFDLVTSMLAKPYFEQQSN